MNDDKTTSTPALEPHIAQRGGAASDFERAHPELARRTKRATFGFDLYMNLMEAYARRHRLRGKSMTMLLWLYYVPAPLTQQDIVRRTYATKQVVNMTITHWRELGYVEDADVAPADRRNRYIQLTERGRDWAKEILDPLRDAELHAMQTLSPDEQDRFTELQHRYLQALGAQLFTGDAA